MNARTIKGLIVLTLTLAACVAPMPAPPVKAPTAPEMEQPVLIPSTQTEQRQNLPAVTDPWAYPDYVNDVWATHQEKVKDAEAAQLLAVQQQLVSRLMVGVPAQARPYLETFAAIKVAEVAIATDSMTTDPDIVRGVLDGSMTTTPYVLPEQKATHPKQPDVQAMDDMLKPESSKAMLAARIAMIEHWAAGTPPEVQQAVASYIDDLKPPAMSAPADTPYWQQPWNMPPAMSAPADTPYWQQPWNMPPAAMPAKAPYRQNVFDQWYLEEMRYVQP
jgi:hypothetical protein